MNATLKVHGDFSSDRYLFFATKLGRVKRTSLDQFRNIRSNGLRAIELVPEDQLIGVQLTHAGQHAILASRAGKSIRFAVEDARAMGRTARGVKGIQLASGDDAVVSMVVVDADATCHLLCVTENGYGKRTPLDEYRVQGRGGKGIITMKVSSRNGPVVAQRAVFEGDEVMVITRGGVIIRTTVDGISVIGRNTQGVRVIGLKSGDAVSTIASIAKAEDIDGDVADEENASGTDASEDGSGPPTPDGSAS